MNRFIELSHVIEDGLVTYPGFPPPVISEFLGREASRGRYAAGTTFHIGRIEMVGNTGTYVDSPFHRYENGEDLADLSLEKLAGVPGVVIRCRGEGSIGVERLEGLRLGGCAVLFDTGWSRHWRSEEYGSVEHPHLTKQAVERLISEKAVIVGIDSVNIDDTSGGERPAHSLLLREGIPIVEHLFHLDDLPDDGFRFFAVPPRLKAFGSFPVRAFAMTGLSDQP